MIIKKEGGKEAESYQVWKIHTEKIFTSILRLDGTNTNLPWKSITLLGTQNGVVKGVEFIQLLHEIIRWKWKCIQCLASRIFSITGMYWGPSVIVTLTWNSTTLPEFESSLKIWSAYFHLALLITLSVAKRAHLFESLDTVCYFTGYHYILECCQICKYENQLLFLQRTI